MNRNMDLADGSLLLTSMINQFKIIHDRPVVFLRYMQDNPTEKKKYFKKWAETMSSFSEQYCQGFLKQSMDSCMSNWHNEVMGQLTKETTVLKKLANEFFKLMGLSFDPPAPIRSDKK